jgi:translation initiation factor IF-1
VVEALKSRLYRVELQNGHRLLGHLSRVACSVLGATGESGIQPATRNPLAVGRKVTVEVSAFDFSKGRILLT